MEQAGLPFLRRLLLSLLLFGLFAEWLRPLAAMGEMTEMYQLTPFLGAVGFYLLIDATALRGWLAWPLKLLFTMLWVGYWFHFEWGWMESEQWWLSAEFRTIVFLAGWAAVVYAVYKIMSDRSHGVWFIAATITYLVMLQLWPGMDTGWGIVRAAGIGLLLLVVLNDSKWERLYGFAFSGGAQSAFVRTTVGVVSGLTVLGAAYALSQAESREVSPVQIHGVEALSTWLEDAGFAEGGRAVSGYDSYDGRLGAPITQDHEVMYEAKTERPTYWRGSTKDVYTGQGWRGSGLSDLSQPFRAAETASITDALEQEITVLHSRLEQTIFAGGTIAKFLAIHDRDGRPVQETLVRFNPDDDSYAVDGVPLRSYRMETLLPASEEQLLALEEGTLAGGPSRRYLQLPAGLPKRVSELAKEIVADVPDNRYLRIKAIQDALQSRYTYTLETRLPPDGADFVDQFLFETQAGYCDHFSTSMVVLLRSIGIEARWVKGFAPGTADPDRPGTFVVRGSDAHSWVEVLFPEVGWVPFEATPGFEAAGAAAGDAGAVPVVSQAEVAQSEAGFGAETAWWEKGFVSVREIVNGVAVTFSEFGLFRLKSMYGYVASAAVVAVCIAALAVLLVRKARRSVMRISQQQRELDVVWRRLYRTYGRRIPTETLREYAARLPLKTPAARAALYDLVRYDETVRYGGAHGRRDRRWLNDLRRQIAKS